MAALLRASITMFAALAVGACDKDSPTPTPAPAPPLAPAEPVPGATQVTGREQLAWEYQPFIGAQYSFQAYVDGSAVSLAAATCVADVAELRCASPLPAMNDGVHSVEVSAVDIASGYESFRSETLTLQKITVRAAQLASALPDARSDTGATRESARTAGAGTADVVARGVRMPAQLALLPDGRLLIAEADGGVRVVHPDASREAMTALEPGALLDPPPTGPLAIAAAADFAETRHVFIADLYVGERTRVRARIVRLREVGDRLGEPATIFDAPVAVDADSAADATSRVGPGSDGLRLAFGADRLMYAALPPGLVFDGQPAASQPVPAIVRLTADGRVPDAGAVSGITSHPLAFAWHPTSGELLGLVADRATGPRLRTLGAPSGAAEPAASGLARFRAEHDGVAQLLRIDASAARVAFAALASGPAAGPPHLPRTIRLAVPTALEDLVPGLTGRLSDVVTQDGVIYGLVTDAAARRGLDAPAGMIVRLRP